MESTTRTNNRLLGVLGWFFGIFFLLGALGSLEHPLLGLIFGLIGLILLPPGHRLIERILRSRLTMRIKLVALVVLFSCGLLLAPHYSEADKKTDSLSAPGSGAETEKQRQERKDSLDHYMLMGDRLAKEHKTEEASNLLLRALIFARTKNEKDSLAKESVAIASVWVSDLVNTGKYSVAIDKLNELIVQDSTNSDLLYNRAVCYNKVGKIPEAVADCKTAMLLGDKQAEILHDKINPPLKRIAYYVTQCCDGTISSAKGRGACSHHGGVCNWSQPVYEEYRKYE